MFKLCKHLMALCAVCKLFNSLKLLGKKLPQPRRAAEPREIRLFRQENAPNNKVAHNVGVGLRINKGERAAPAGAIDNMP